MRGELDLSNRKYKALEKRRDNDTGRLQKVREEHLLGDLGQKVSPCPPGRGLVGWMVLQKGQDRGPTRG